jgi:hypothetical protein
VGADTPEYTAAPGSRTPRAPTHTSPCSHIPSFRLG